MSRRRARRRSQVVPSISGAAAAEHCYNASVKQQRGEAVERVAELATRGNPKVTEAAGRLGDEELNIDIGMGRATTAADTLSDVRGRISTEVDRHQLLSLRVQRDADRV